MGTTDPVEREWKRLLNRLRRQGAAEASEHVAELIGARKYPVYYSYKFATHLLHLGEFEAAEKVLKATKEAGQADPLLDEVIGSLLWSLGKRREAIKFVTRKAKHWSASHLFNTLSAMHSLEGNQKKAQKYLRVAALRAEEELARLSPAQN